MEQANVNPVVEEGVNETAPAEQEVREQTVEERAGFAAARRRAEAESKAQLDEMQNRMDRYAKYNGYNNWDELEQETSKARLEESGLSEDALYPLLDRVVSQHPLLKAAQEMQIQASVDKSFDDFKANYPDSGINTVEDFAKMDNYDKFYEYVCRGLDYSDAYTLANKDNIVNKKVAQAKQATLNSVNGKGHLQTATGDGSVDNVSVPDDVYDYYKKLLGWSDKQIRSHYSKSQKG